MDTHGSSSLISEPLDAATVILIRDSSQGQFKLFLMRRHRDQTFMAGAFVFPGGRLDVDDCDPELHMLAAGLTPSVARQRLQEPHLTVEKAIGLFFAAVRETFEEAGVLLAYDASGRLVNFKSGEIAGRFAPYRLDMHQKQLTLKALARKEDIRYALDRLIPYSHWITPEVESKRFDTRFFLALHPQEQFSFHDTIEMTESLWISPSEALECHRAGDIALMPPTLKTIDELNAFQHTEELLAAAAVKQIPTILPQPFVKEDGFGVKLPHDAEYSLDRFKQAPRPGEPSRIVMKNRRWSLVVPEREG